MDYEMKHHTGDKYAYIVGNKCDKVEKNSTEIMVNIYCVDKFAKEYNISFMETSAKTGKNIDKIFETCHDGSC